MRERERVFDKIQIVKIWATFSDNIMEDGTGSTLNGIV